MKFIRNRPLFRFTAGLMLAVIMTSCVEFVPLSLERKVGFETTEQVRIHLRNGSTVIIRGFWVDADSLGGEVVAYESERLVVQGMRGQQISLGIQEINELEYQEKRFNIAVIFLIGITAALAYGALTREVTEVHRHQPH